MVTSMHEPKSMQNHNAENERIKREYFSYLEETKGQDEATVDSVAEALFRFEASTKWRSFGAFRKEQAVAFKRHLSESNSPATGRRLSQATRYAILSHLKRFFHWLAGQPGYKSRLIHSHADYFNLSKNESRIATARREAPFPTLDQVRHVVAKMPVKTDIQKRNRAVIAFTLLTGMRDSAVASVRLKHIDLAAECVHQDARDVKTKFAKSFDTTFFPVGPEIKTIVIDWVRYLRADKLAGNEHPLFPSTAIAPSSNHRFQVVGLGSEHWRGAGPIRGIFRDAFAAAGLPYYNPHSLRKTLVHLGQTLCKSTEDFKAWSQNLGHEKVLTTFYSYGQVAQSRQAEIIQQLSQPSADDSANPTAMAKAIARELAQMRANGTS